MTTSKTPTNDTDIPMHEVQNLVNKNFHSLLWKDEPTNDTARAEELDFKDAIWIAIGDTATSRKVERLVDDFIAQHTDRLLDQILAELDVLNGKQADADSVISLTSITHIVEAHKSTKADK